MLDPGGIRLTENAARAIAAISAFRDQAPLLAALQAEFGATPPSTAGFVQSGDITLSRLAPSRLLITAPRETALLARVTHTLAGLAAITDQSDQWSSWQLDGSGVRDVLARVVPIDLAPASFPVGALALTHASHLHVRLWRLGDAIYDVAVSRSYAPDLHHALVAAQVDK